MFGHFCDLGNVLSVCVYIYMHVYICWSGLALSPYLFFKKI